MILYRATVRNRTTTHRQKVYANSPAEAQERALAEFARVFTNGGTPTVRIFDFNGFPVATDA